MTEPEPGFADELDEVPSESLEEALDGVAIEEIPELADDLTTTSMVRLLRGLSQSVVDFQVRFAAIQQLIAKENSLRAQGDASVSRDDLDRMLHWLKPHWRQRTIASLQRWGWWHFEGSSWRTSQAGLNLYRYLLSAVQSKDDNAILEALVMADASQELGHDPIRALQALQRQVDQLFAEIEQANELHSSILMRQAKAKIPKSLKMGEALVNFKPGLFGDPAINAEIRKTHTTMSRLSKASSQMEKSLNIFESQQVTLPEHCTLDDVIQALMLRDKDDIARAVMPAIHRPYVPTTYLNPSRIVYAAEDFLSRARDEQVKPDWDKPDEEPTPATIHDEWLADARQLVQDIRNIPATVSEVPLADVVVRATPHQSLLRLALLGLMGAKEAQSGVAGDLGDLPFRIETDEGMVDLFGKAVSKISKGRIRRVKT